MGLSAVSIVSSFSSRVNCWHSVRMRSFTLCIAAINTLKDTITAVFSSESYLVCVH